MSPGKKRRKLASIAQQNNFKRENEGKENLPKRLKSEHSQEENVHALKRKNFIQACEQVSCEAYLNYAKRLKLIYLPTCIDRNNCKHDSKDLKVNQMPPYAEESFNIEIKTNMWCDALEVCYLCLTPTQYLSANVMKNVAEIMLNAHEDPDADYGITYILEKCQQILSQSFSTHPPCHMKAIRKCYNNFLTSPMDLKENTFTNRSQFGYDKGIVKYCMNRLEYEISSESKDGPLVDKYENVPDEMKQSVKGLHWQKEKFEIFETLKRNDRIKRLMSVLESVIELIQFDLAIWHSRYNYYSGSQIMRSQRPLMAFVLWSDNILYTGAVTNNCRQMFRIFVYFIHLQYSEEYIKIMTVWLNALAQTFYICENNSNSDYPNIGKYSAAFAKEFYKIIEVLPQDSIYRILERIQPTFMQYIIGNLHIQTIISTKEHDIIKLINNFVKKSLWEKYQASSNEIFITNTSNRLKVKKIKNVTNYLSKIVQRAQKKRFFHNSSEDYYPKYDNSVLKYSTIIDRSHIVSTLYITLTAYLDAYSVEDVQEKLDTLNEQLLTDEQMVVIENYIPENCSYTTTEHFIKKYRSIYEMLKELMVTLHELKSNEQLPEVLKIFENIRLLSL